MAGGANQQFLANPVQFMTNNIVRVNYEGPETDVPLDFDLVDAGVTEYKRDRVAGISKGMARKHQWTGVSATNETMKVYDLVAFGPSRYFSHPIRAYWLAYKANTCQKVQLGPGARFVFTVTINGCSVGIGTGKHPRLGHANHQIKVDGLAQTDQGQMDIQIQSAIPGGRTLLSKTDYTIEGQKTNVTFFGHFNNDAWGFWWQSRQGRIDYAGGDRGTATVHEQSPLQTVN